MNKLDLDINFVRQLRTEQPNLYCKILKKHHQEICKAIEDFAQNIKCNYEMYFPQKIYHWINQLHEIPLCPIKKTPLKFYKHKFEYRKFSERGLFTEEFAKNRMKGRTKFPTAKERMSNIDANFQYEENYKERAFKQISEMFDKIQNIGGVCTAIKTKKNAKLYSFVKNLYLTAETFSECLFLFLNNMTEPPLCPFSGLPLPFVNFKQGYKDAHPSAVRDLKRHKRQEKLQNLEILSKEETIMQLQMMIDELRKSNISINNLKQSAVKRCPRLAISIEEHTKTYTTLTKKWSERAYLLLHEGETRDLAKCRFSSFDEGYYDTFVNPNSSFGEESLASWIESLNVGKIRRHERLLNGMEADIYVENVNLAIEYHGEYYHNFEFRGAVYHKQKADIALNKNMQLLQIFESEWYNKQEIVKSIIKSKLGIISNKINARSCSIKQLVTKTKDEFLSLNHIQGTDRSAVSLGLYYNGALVCCMTFGRGYNKKDKQTELVRFCNKLNTTVVGGASKLLKAFISQFKPAKLFTYADRRFANSSKFYETIGFQQCGQTLPNYFYFKSSMPQYMKLIHRYNFAKHLLPRKLKQYDANQTEYQNMKQNGYLKIYDAGSFKYELFCELPDN
jgi:hypothetical protein